MQVKLLATQGERTSEIAAAVQDGSADILSLWAATERFAAQQARRWCRAMEGRAGVEECDLMQAAFLALMDALATWDAGKGEFLTWYGVKLKTVFADACGQRTMREKNDPINTVCRSLDEPIGDEDDTLVLGDVITDEAAERAFEAVEQREFQQAVREMLAQLPEKQRRAIIGEFWLGQKPEAKVRQDAIRALRHPKIRSLLAGVYR